MWRRGRCLMVRGPSNSQLGRKRDDEHGQQGGQPDPGRVNVRHRRAFPHRAPVRGLCSDGSLPANRGTCAIRTYEPEALGLASPILGTTSDKSLDEIFILRYAPLRCRGDLDPRPIRHGCWSAETAIPVVLVEVAECESQRLWICAQVPRGNSLSNSRGLEEVNDHDGVNGAAAPAGQDPAETSRGHRTDHRAGGPEAGAVAIDDLPDRDGPGGCPSPRCPRAAGCLRRRRGAACRVARTCAQEPPAALVVRVPRGSERLGGGLRVRRRLHPAVRRDGLSRPFPDQGGMPQAPVLRSIRPNTPAEEFEQQARAPNTHRRGSSSPSKEGRSSGSSSTRRPCIARSSGRRWGCASNCNA